MLLISKSFLLPFVVLTGGLLYTKGVDKTNAEGEVMAGGGIARFNLNARDPSDPSGHLKFDDDDANFHLRSTSVTAYLIQSELHRRIEGTGVLKDGTEVTWAVNAFDLGSGTEDQFGIVVSNGYSDNGFLVKGNVKITPGQ